MTPEKFMTALETYYGEYANAAQKQIVIHYIRNFDDNKIDEIFRKLLLTFSNVYKTPPSVSDIEKVTRGDENAKAEKAWLSVSCVSDSESILCMDIVLQETIVSMGGWYEFCQYREKTNAFCHKDFISRYIALAGVTADHRVLCGYADKFWNPEIRYENVKIIGDKETGIKLLLNLIKKGNTEIENIEGFKKITYETLMAQVEKCDLKLK